MFNVFLLITCYIILFIEEFLRGKVSPLVFINVADDPVLSLNSYLYGSKCYEIAP